jgi:hypothetical protein
MWTVDGDNCPSRESVPGSVSGSVSGSVAAGSFSLAREQESVFGDAITSSGP